MRLDRLGSLHQSRLSFMRVLIRRMVKEQWTTSPPLFDIDANGVGRAVYTVQGPERAYSLIAFAHDIPDAKRSDRVIADTWDTTFCLFDGVPAEEDIDRLQHNVPLQEAGRISQSELCLSRANRSVRLWSYVVDALASGQQPELEELLKVGYLMRTTAVYGSGKFGAADRETYAQRPELHAPFQAEMLTVFLIRTFVRDLVQHMAICKGGDNAVELAPDIARHLGIGNSTGLGMAPFIVNHPVLFNNWIEAREEAIARVRSVEHSDATHISIFKDVHALADMSAQRWTSEHPVQQGRLAALRNDLSILHRHLQSFNWADKFPWDRLVRWASGNLSLEGQEWLNSLILEPYDSLVDSLAGQMSDEHSDAFCIDGSMTVGETRQLIAEKFGWARKLDWNAREHSARLWYVSEEKLEPRIGDRFEESLEDYEQPLAPARDAVAAYQAMSDWHDTQRIGQFLTQCPEHRQAVRRAQMCRTAVFGEIRDNTIANGMLPIDMLRAKLSFFGATHFDPRSDRWVRVKLFSGAPYANELHSMHNDLWVYH